MTRAPHWLVDEVESLRLVASREVDRQRKAQLGQFLTPASVARRMAAMLECRSPLVRLLDAGAGIGSLFAACVAELCGRDTRPQHIHVVAYEIDPQLAGRLPQTFRHCQVACEQAGIRFTAELREDDFIRSTVESVNGDLFTPRQLSTFNCAILNPPYQKIQTRSSYRRLLRQLGIEANNLYSGFVATTVRLLEPDGEVVAITPRSFCNGPYFKSFRRFFLERMTLDKLHLFESRQEAFRDDSVLQENIILHARKRARKPERVTVTTSAGTGAETTSQRAVAYRQVVDPADPELFIRVVIDDASESIADRMRFLSCSLSDLGLEVSTGRVVDFRAREYLRWQPEEGTAPLIYPAHFAGGYVVWPKLGMKKPNALANTEQTKTLLVPNGHYVLVRRLSAKEEKRRIVAAVHDAARVPGEFVGFENHLNFYHQGGRGLALEVAKGLTAYLNSSLVDAYFRQFNGHTQVNATDLRNIRYPTWDQLAELGAQLLERALPQAEFDSLVERGLLHMPRRQLREVSGVEQRIAQALAILGDLGLPAGQQNERSASTLLALLDLKPGESWSSADDPLLGITPMMQFFERCYGVRYAPNTRETVRRQTIHQSLDAGLVIQNPDKPDRPTNSGKTVYQMERGALELLRTYETPDWDANLAAYLASTETLRERYAQERWAVRIAVTIAPGTVITLSAGGQNVLVERIVAEFAPRFTPGGRIIYVGDTDEKFAYFDSEALVALGVEIEAHGKMPDVIVHHQARGWLVLIEAVTSHGPIDPKRRAELQRLFAGSTLGLVFVTAFLTRRAMVRYLGDISWETEVWVAESPSHLIHFDGEKFLGPYGESGEEM